MTEMSRSIIGTMFTAESTDLRPPLFPESTETPDMDHLQGGLTTATIESSNGGFWISPVHAIEVAAHAVDVVAKEIPGPRRLSAARERSRSHRGIVDLSQILSAIEMDQMAARKPMDRTSIQWSQSSRECFGGASRSPTPPMIISRSRGSCGRYVSGLVTASRWRKSCTVSFVDRSSERTIDPSGSHSIIRSATLTTGTLGIANASRGSTAASNADV